MWKEKTNTAVSPKNHELRLGQAIVANQVLPRAMANRTIGLPLSAARQKMVAYILLRICNLILDIVGVQGQAQLRRGRSKLDYT